MFKKFLLRVRTRISSDRLRGLLGLLDPASIALAWLIQMQIKVLILIILFRTLPLIDAVEHHSAIALVVVVLLLVIVLIGIDYYANAGKSFQKETENKHMKGV